MTPTEARYYAMIPSYDTVRIANAMAGRIRTADGEWVLHPRQGNLKSIIRLEAVEYFKKAPLREMATRVADLSEVRALVENFRNEAVRRGEVRHYGSQFVDDAVERFMLWMLGNHQHRSSF